MMNTTNTPHVRSHTRARALAMNQTNGTKIQKKINKKKKRPKIP